MKRLSLVVWGVILSLLLAAAPTEANTRVETGLTIPHQPMKIPHHPIVLPGHDRLQGPPQYRPRYPGSYTPGGHKYRYRHPGATRHYHPPLRYKRHHMHSALYFHRPGIHRPSVGIYVSYLPHGSQRVVIGGTIYFVFGDSHSSNTWYYWDDGYRRYQVVGIPPHYSEYRYFTPGSVVDRLPRGTREIHYGGVKYYRYRDTFFEPMTARRGLYRVVDNAPDRPSW